MKGVHCVEYSTKRIEPIYLDQTVSSCNDFCNENINCVEFAIGRENNYLNECHLFRSKDCAYTTNWNFDIYRPSKNGNCPPPLTTKTLIKNNWKCNDNYNLKTGPDSDSNVSLDECDTLCK